MKQLKFYCFSAILFLQSCGNVSEPELETIVYINLGDIQIGYYKSFSLDIDFDEDAEFYFSTLFVADAIGDHLSFRMSPRRLNQAYGIDNQLIVLNKGEQIRTSDSFFRDLHPLTVKTITQNESYWSGDWMNADHNYAGIRFRLKGQGYHYGWLRISVDQVNGVMIIHDMAYNSIENSGINAGEM